MDKAVSATDQSNSVMSSEQTTGLSLMLTTISQDTEGRIKDLESALEKYHAKYKEEKRERKKLQTVRMSLCQSPPCQLKTNNEQTCKALEDQLAHLEEEGGGKSLKLVRIRSAGAFQLSTLV